MAGRWVRMSDSYSVFTDYLLAQGWAVLRTNPRGSTGRGAEFAAANKNDLGGADYRDIMAGVDYVLKTEPIDARQDGADRVQLWRRDGGVCRDEDARGSRRL